MEPTFQRLFFGLFSSSDIMSTPTLQSQEAQISVSALTNTPVAVPYMHLQTTFYASCSAVRSIIALKLFKQHPKHVTITTYFKNRWGITKMQAKSLAECAKVGVS